MPKNITRVKWEASGLPFGVSFDERDGTFSGTPQDVGTHVVPVKVTTNYGSDTKDVILQVEDTWNNDDVNTINTTKCVDDGEKIIFFGNTLDGKAGAFYSYNPQDETKSDILKLAADGVKDDTSFKDVAIDPVSKKWITFFGTHYIRNPKGVRDLGSNFDLVQIACCWSNTLQRFCAIAKNSAGEYISYLFDIDGNFISSSTQLQEIDNYNGVNNIAWSDTANCFTSVSMSMISSSQPYRIIVYSPDGLLWGSSRIAHTTKMTGTTRYYGRNANTKTLTTLNDGTFIAVMSASYSVSDNAEYWGFLFKSVDGINWTPYSTLENYINGAAWSSTKDKCYALVRESGSSRQFTIKGTNNFSRWSTSASTPFLTSGVSLYTGAIYMIWSDTANALVIPAYSNGFRIITV